MHPTRPQEPGPTRGRPSGSILAAVVAVIAVLIAACGDDDGHATGSDPAGVIEDYVTAYNDGDIDAVMALFTDGSVITGHPWVASQSGLDEIRRILEEDRAAAADADAYSISNVEVSDDTVTWDHVWTRSDGVERCVDGHTAVVAGGKIVSWAWPETDFNCQ